MPKKLHKGYEQFDSLGDCLKFVKELAGQYPGNGPAYYDVTGTPAESLYGANEVSYNGGKYDFTGWGSNRNTPWGTLPNIIIAIRSDLSKLIRKEPTCMSASPVQKTEKNKPLAGPNWKPAPGFERPW